MTPWRWAAAATATVSLLGVMAWAVGCNGCAGEMAGPAGLRAPSLMAAGSHSDPGTAAAGRTTPAEPASELRPVAVIDRLLFVTGSLRGTDFPAWGVTRGAPLQPNRALRDRFDHYLLGMGEASVGELGHVLRAHALRDLGESTAAEVMAVWERYVTLQRHEFRHVAQVDDLASMQTSLQEHQQVRQRVLGVPWAKAFYGEEELRLATDISHRQQGIEPPVDPTFVLFQPAPGTEPQALHRDRAARFGADKAERLREIDEEQVAWEQRISRARKQLETFRLDAALSDLQRAEAMARYLDTEFTSPSERLRAVALISAVYP